MLLLCGGGCCLTLTQSGSVLTCEVDERAAKIAQKYFESSPHGHKIRLELGPAMDVLHR